MSYGVSKTLSNNIETPIVLTKSDGKQHIIGTISGNPQDANNNLMPLRDQILKHVQKYTITAAPVLESLSTQPAEQQWKNAV